LNRFERQSALKNKSQSIATGNGGGPITETRDHTMTAPHSMGKESQFTGMLDGENISNVFNSRLDQKKYSVTSNN